MKQLGSFNQFINENTDSDNIFDLFNRGIITKDQLNIFMSQEQGKDNSSGLGNIVLSDDQINYINSIVTPYTLKLISEDGDCDNDEECFATYELVDEENKYDSELQMYQEMDDDVFDDEKATIYLTFYYGQMFQFFMENQPIPTMLNTQEEILDIEEGELIPLPFYKLSKELWNDIENRISEYDEY
jgi:hypothetical protein